jgi:secreted PhoX family phosphatase
MDIQDVLDLSLDDFDEFHDPRSEVCDFDGVVDRALDRRGFLGGVLAFGSAATLGLAGTQARAVEPMRFAFEPLGIATDHAVHVPQGYQAQVLVRWGDALWSEAENSFSPENGVPLSLSDRVFGENTDGMALFVIDGREILAVNSEFANIRTNLPPESGGLPRSLDDIQLLKNLQGVTIMEIEKRENGYGVVVDSRFNRRITHDTPCMVSGPLAGHALLKTKADPTGRHVMGTLNNCGSGRTPWGTYLTCEENFNGYFGASDMLPEGAGYTRYGLRRQGRFGYELYDPRFDVSHEPNEPHRHGYVVEIDPANPSSTPIKRTALGRFKHENAALVQGDDGRIVVYMGDDERGEFLYRYVSAGTWHEGQGGGDQLDRGQLYVARFNDDLSGDWIALTPEATGMDEAAIHCFTRIAASAVGATTMDRPEWVAVNPQTPEAYCALTNNRNRGVKPNAGGDPTPVNGPNPRAENHYGQIVRWRPDGGDHASDRFEWELFVMAGNPEIHADAYAGSSNITAGNMFNSPDGIAFSSDGMLWIQTDGEDENQGDFAGMGNNQMLIGNPQSGEIARFMTAPNGAEVAGLCWSADRKTAFVGIQHPGGSWPDGVGRPRSSIIAISREDGKPIG